jgi:hypothetical protein
MRRTPCAELLGGQVGCVRLLSLVAMDGRRWTLALIGTNRNLVSATFC